jgi:hypothetical protein
MKLSPGLPQAKDELLPCSDNTRGTGIANLYTVKNTLSVMASRCCINRCFREDIILAI